MATAYRVDAMLVLAKDQDGSTVHYYQGRIIQWLSDEQAAQFLADGFVTAIEVESEAEVETKAFIDRVSECLEALAATDLPADCGAPTAREALRDSGHKFGNDTIAAAIRMRRGVSGTPVSAPA